MVFIKRSEVEVFGSLDFKSKNNGRTRAISPTISLSDRVNQSWHEFQLASSNGTVHQFA